MTDHASDEEPLPAVRRRPPQPPGPRVAGRGARGRGDRPAVRAVAHPGRRPDRPGASSRSTGRRPSKSDRVFPGSALDVTIPAVADPLEVKPEVVEGIRIIHDDAGDRRARQAGRRRRAPVPGLDRPDRRRPPGRRRLPDRHQRRLRAAGHRAAAGRRHVGRDGDLQVRARLLQAQERVPAPRGRQDLPRPGPGPPGPARGHHRRPDRAAPEVGLEVRGDGRRPPQRHALLDARGAPVRRACSRCTSRPAAPTRSGCTWRR